MIFNQTPGVANADGVTPTTAGPITYSGGSVNGKPAAGGTVAGTGRSGNGLPDVQGAQYASPGAAGVTSYGLFSNAGGGARPPGQMPPKGPTLPPGFVGRQPGQGQLPLPPMRPGPPLGDPGQRARDALDGARVRINPGATSRLPGAAAGAKSPGMMQAQRMGPGGPQTMQRGDPRALVRFLQTQRPPAPTQTMTNQMGGNLGGGQGPLGQQGGNQLMNVLRSAMGRQAMGGGNPQQPQAMQTSMQQPPPNQQGAGLQQQFNQQQQAQQAQRDNQASHALKSGESGPNPAGEALQDFGEYGGQALGEGYAAAVDAWNRANPGSNASWFDFFDMPGFDPSSIMGDVGQNWTSAMDPAAWEQMARNRLAAANEANRGALNLGERRLADRAGRSGFANTGGVTSQMYQDYAGRGIQSERDIFNDTLMNQMNALQGASQFALGQNAQDQARWAAEAGFGAHGADQDFGANREDNPSGAAMIRDMIGAGAGAAGGAAGMAGQGVASLMNLLPLFLMA